MVEIKLWQPNDHSIYKVRYRELDSGNPEYITVDDVVRKHYASHMPKPVQVEKLTGKEGGSSNNYRVTGTDGRVIHLKNFLRFKGDPGRLKRENETLERMMAVTDHLLGNGVKTFFFLNADNGMRYVRENGSQWMASNFIEGDHYKGTSQQLQQFAEELAKMDRAMQSFKKAIKSELVEIPFNPAVIHKLKEKNRKAMSENPTEMDYLARTVINGILEPKLPEIDNKAKGYSFEPGITVGNVHPHHTLYMGDELRAVSDFEKASYGYPVIEGVAFSMHRFVRQAIVYILTEHEHEPKEDEIKQLSNVFLESYTKNNELSDKEIEAIPVMIAKTNAHKALRILQYRYGLEKDTMEGPVEKHMSELCKFGAHILEAEHFRF